MSDMGYARKRTLVQCKACGKEWVMENGNIKQWLGRCKSCSHKGKIFSDETRRRLSASATGRKVSAITRKKMSDRKRGLPLAPWITEKAHATWTGKHHPKERRQIMAEQKMGSRNPNWNGGTSFDPYVESFTEQLRESVRDRQGRKCLLCGEKENGRRLTVHHIDYNKQNSDPDNLVAMCLHCHNVTNLNRADWKMALSCEVTE